MHVCVCVCCEGGGCEARGQRESANEEKQHNCQGLPGAGQTWLKGGLRAAKAKG